MFLALLKDAVKLALICALLFLLLKWYVAKRKPHFADTIAQHRLTILFVLAIILIGIKVSEEALDGDSGPADKAILLFVHRNIPQSWSGAFAAITLSGSFYGLVTLSILCGAALALARKWFEVLLLTCSIICGGLVIFVLKTLTARDRPALWETRWYWGTSFPSGHTLETACCATALAMCAARLWPEQAKLLRIFALCWVSLVGFSRLVLGVHWPTDVLAAGCIGMLIPIAIRFLLQFWYQPQSTNVSAS